MSWLDDYRQASFRGIEFYIPGHEVSGGRRNQVTEFPGRDEAFVEDLGRRAKRIAIEAYVIGEDYHVQRNKLILALDKKGPGKLVHPYLGDIQVAITDYSYRDTVQEMGMCRFTITFVEAGVIKFPIKTIDSVTKVATAKESSLDALKSRFERLWKIARVPRTVADAAIASIDKGLDTMEDAKSSVSFISSFQSSITAFRASLLSIAFSAQELIENTIDLMRFGTDEDDEDVDVTAESAKLTFEDLKPLNSFEPDDVITDQEDEPSVVFTEAYRISAVINQAGLLSLIEFDSATSAEEFRNYVFQRLDEILEYADDELYIALYDLRTSVAEHIDIKSRTLPRVGQYQSVVTLPAFLISYDIYGTINREQEIIDRNKISHPAYVPGSVPIEVLIDVG